MHFYIKTMQCQQYWYSDKILNHNVKKVMVFSNTSDKALYVAAYTELDWAATYAVVSLAP